MKITSVTDHHYEQALNAVAESAATGQEKVEMLMEIAMGLQQKPKNQRQLLDAVTLYEHAEELCGESDHLLKARIEARKGTAYQAIPSDDANNLQKALFCLQSALTVLSAHGTEEEVAEAEMNLGLTLQSLAGFHQAPIADAIAAYQRALRIFTKDRYPAEFAILHNNLATAFLSIPMTDERGKMREALAVQSFESALEVVTLIDNPSEYAMLQNNLGNALQYVSSSHSVENSYRALDAYNEALKVRNPKDTPLEYANTISNKANCLLNLPDNPEDLNEGNHQNTKTAHGLYVEAKHIFQQFGDFGKCQVIDEVLGEITPLLSSGKDHKPKTEHEFGESRIN